MNIIRIVLLLALLSGRVFSANASTIMPACNTAQTIAEFVPFNSTGCSILDKLFRDFTFPSGATGRATALQAADLSVTLVDDSPAEIGVRFSGFSLNARSRKMNNLTLRYTVPGPSITSEHLAMVGAATQLTDDATFDPSEQDWSPQGNERRGGRSRFAYIFDITEAFGKIVGPGKHGAAPEPATLALIGGGLIAFGLINRRRKQKL